MDVDNAAPMSPDEVFRWWVRRLSSQIVRILDSFLTHGVEGEPYNDMHELHRWWVHRLGPEIVRVLDSFSVCGVEEEMLIALLD